MEGQLSIHRAVFEAKTLVQVTLASQWHLKSPIMHAVGAREFPVIYPWRDGSFTQKCPICTNLKEVLEGLTNPLGLLVQPAFDDNASASGGKMQGASELGLFPHFFFFCKLA